MALLRSVYGGFFFWRSARRSVRSATFMKETPFKRTATLTDVARLAGVNKSTVSRALRDCSHVGKATREKVRKAAAALDYHPDPVIARMAAERWRKDGRQRLEPLGVLVGKHSDRSSRLVRYARSMSVSYGYEVDVLNLSDFVNWESLSRRLKYRNVEKLIAIGFEEGEVLDTELVESFKVVSCGAILEQPVCSVDLDWIRMLDLAIEYFRRQGLERIGLALEGVEPRERRILKTRYDRRLYDLGGSLPVFESGANIGVQRDSFLCWLNHYKPDGVICLGFELLEEMRGALAEGMPFASLEHRGTGNCQGVVGFCCGENLMVERSIQLTRLSKLSAAESGMEVHHIVPDWRSSDRTTVARACV